MPVSEFSDLRHAINELQRSITALHARFGGAAGVRRLENDLERLEIDANDLQHSPPTAQPMRGSPGDVVYVPDSKSDEAAWMGAQDEGLGFHSRKRTS